MNSSQRIMDSGFELDLENADWSPNTRYPTAGFPPQPFRVVIPAEISPIITPRLRLRLVKEDDVEGLTALKDIPEHLRYHMDSTTASRLQKMGIEKR